MSSGIQVSSQPSQVGSSDFRKRALQFFQKTHGLDVRSLALFRVALALIILGDLWQRARDLNAFYTDFGALPRYALLENFADQWIISLHLMSGKWQVQAILFVIAGIFALALLVGYRTRWATVASWIMLTSLQNRNPVILQGGDTLFRMLLFWSMFLPLGLTHSVDSALDEGSPEVKKPETIFSAASVALMVQIAIVYWFAVILKTGSEWRVEGSAVYYALSLEQMATPLGRAMLHFPILLKFLTFFTLAVEALAPVFLFSPFLFGPVRSVAVLFLISLQLGFATFLNVGHFPFIASAMMLPMLPSWFWDIGIDSGPRSAKWKADRSGLRIYYDGECSFCKKMVLIIRALVLDSATPLIAAQSDSEIHREMVEQKSWVVVDATGHSFKTEGMSVLLQHSPIFFFWPVARLIRWRPIQQVGDVIYGKIEGNRSLLSSAVSFLRNRPLRWQASPLTNTVVTFLLLYVIWWNIGMVSQDRMIPVQYRWLGVSIRLDQIWDMFAPTPLKEDGWYVIPGTLRNGQQVDIFRNGAPVSFDRPSPNAVAGQYKDERWRKYLLNIYGAAYTPYRLYYGRYLCRNWNEGKGPNDPRLLDSFEIYFMVRPNVPFGQPPLPIEKAMLHRHYCFR